MLPTPPKNPLPAATADCVTTLKAAADGVNPKQVASRWSRSLDGKMRFDSGMTSVITDPASGKVLLLDHLKKEARVFQPNPPAMPTQPGMPDFSSMMPKPQTPDMNVQDLGKRVIDGVMAEGKRYMLQPPQAPNMPNMPNMPTAPKPDLSMLEVWTNPETQFPVLTRSVGSFGEEIRQCKVAPVPDPSPAMFQIPPGYNLIDAYAPPAIPNLPSAASAIPGGGIPSAPSVPSAPGLPNMPSAPAMPAAPAMPGVPSAPAMPGVPSAPAMPAVPAMPSAPAVPSAPSAPSVPSAPKPPGIPKF